MHQAPGIPGDALAAQDGREPRVLERVVDRAGTAVDDDGDALLVVEKLEGGEWLGALTDPSEGTRVRAEWAAVRRGH